MTTDPAVSAPPPPPPPPPPTDPDASGQAAGPSEGSGEQAGGQPVQTESKDRDYSIYSEVTLDFSHEPSAIVDQIKAIVGTTPEGAQVPQANVLVRVGVAPGRNPKKAVEALGHARDLNGDYEVIANTSKNTVPKVRAGMRREVTIG